MQGFEVIKYGDDSAVVGRIRNVEGDDV